VIGRNPIRSSPISWLGNRLAEREKKWAAFVSDPEWLAGRDESEKDGPNRRPTVVNSILQPTAFSSVR